MTTQLPFGLVERAKSLGPEWLVMLHEAHAAGRAEGFRAARKRAIAICDRQCLELEVQYDRLTEEDVASIDTHYGDVGPSPAVAAHYGSAVASLTACRSLIAKLDER